MQPDSEDLTQRVRENLQALMAQRRLTAVEVARTAGLSRSVVHDLLTGRIASPRLATLQDIAAKGLQVELAALLYGPSGDRPLGDLRALSERLDGLGESRRRQMISCLIDLLRLMTEEAGEGWTLSSDPAQAACLPAPPVSS
jgi:transcriptional regulator with XRE-family HTH domain